MKAIQLVLPTVYLAIILLEPATPVDPDDISQDLSELGHRRAHCTFSVSNRLRATARATAYSIF